MEKDLMTMGMTQSEFGEALINEAQNRKQKERLEKSVSVAQNIISGIEEKNKEIAWLQGWKETFEGQLSALKKGEFSFDALGSIVYNDPALNRK